MHIYEHAIFVHSAIKVIILCNAYKFIFSIIAETGLTPHLFAILKHEYCDRTNTIIRKSGIPFFTIYFRLG